jgi:hypothetical protein
MSEMPEQQVPNNSEEDVARFEAQLEQRVVGLKEQNVRMTHEINQAGAAIDVGQARVEKFIDFLVNNGALTNLQRLMEQEQWELHLRGQLQNVVQAVRAQAAAAGRDVRTGGGIILPGKR